MCSSRSEEIQQTETKKSFVSKLHQARAYEGPGSRATGLGQTSVVPEEQRQMRGHEIPALSTHRNILRSVESLSVRGILFPETRLCYFWHQDSHKQLFLKGGKRKLPTRKINAVDYSESNAEATERKWKKQIVSNVNVTVPLKYSSCAQAHTLYLTKTMDKAGGIGRWLCPETMNGVHVSYLFHFPIHAIFL